MGIKVFKNDEDIYIIDVDGELDLPTSNALKELVMRMYEQKVERFIINMGNVKSVDSAGLGALANISSTIGKLSARLAMSNVGEAVKEVLKNAKLVNYIHITDSIREAVELMRGFKPKADHLEVLRSKTSYCKQK
jgi:anti-sigma B factor antagonist